ncbi:MAG: valine--tRNA ligase [Candidatus Altimarinota bacterium]
MSDFPKQYDPKICEGYIQSIWKEKNIGSPLSSKTGETFYIPIPPPNVTGNLHLGHALTLTLEDIMSRYHRLKGDATLWVPGTDHAGIATQAQVEKRLERQGSSRKSLGREKFLEACRDWVKEYGGNIQKQMSLMGASVSWEHERYTFDEKSNHLVEDVFVELYKRGLIYRGEYMVNYSPVLESVISDIEVEYQELDEKMYYVNYFVSGSDKEIMVATTRPETMLADQAIAVHPKDKRYKKLIGRSVVLPIVNKEIPIIADDMVDMEFGTGAVKITPAHDPSDFEFAKRHNLRTNYRVIDKNGFMTKEAGTFAGLKGIEEARSNIVELLRAKGNLVRVEPYKHKVGFCSRGKCRIESVVSTQWFVKADLMAKKVIEGYEKKEFTIIPSRYEKVFEDWIYNLRDWCISRQLWWGHQIPAYYHKESGELLGVTRDPTQLEEKYGKENLVRDSDVLDTWFSSGLWPFSILDWNFENPGELFKKFYPANVLETGHDILFFWVIRMLLMGYELTGQTPFKTIYLHGLILDENGKKMSKSWGNVIDPIEVIQEYSADALRLATVLGNTPGNNLNFSKNTVAEYGLFLNKLWNIVRFTWMNVGDISKNRSEIEKEILKNKDELLPYESWILSRLAKQISRMTEGMEDYSFSLSGSELLSFIRDEFADFAIEAYKIEKDHSKVGSLVMQLCILDILTLLHPYAPHITEMLYGQITGGKILATSEWPKTLLKSDEESESSMTRIWNVIRTLRNLRAESSIKPGEYRKAYLSCPKIYLTSLESNINLIEGLARIQDLEITLSQVKHPGFSYGVVDGIDIYFDASIDAEKILEERSRLEKEIQTKKTYIRSMQTKLKNNAFISNAPEKVVRAEMEKLHIAETELKKFEEKLTQLEEV